MLIQNAEIYGHGTADLRIRNGHIAEIGQLIPHADEPTRNAYNNALLPGLHDHHIHLAALAVRTASIICGPPEVCNEVELSARFLSHQGKGWLRGILYHESVMGLPTATQLDRIIAHRPVRIQHRSGRMWLLNSLALAELLTKAAPPPGLERANGQYTGRLFDEDAWLQTALSSTPPPFAAISAQLAAHGITGLTDMTPRNDRQIAAHFAAEIASGALHQRIILALVRMAMRPRQTPSA
jgi:predicted amidohydrolase YtcJ